MINWTRRFFFGLFRVLSSYSLACVIMTLLFVLTFLGTLEEARIGLYAAQQRYFTSLLVWLDLPGGLRLPLPGAYTLMVLFCVNLTLGGVVRLRRRSGLGLLVVHGGILVLMLGGLVTHHFAREGSMALARGESANRFESYHDWEVAIAGPFPAADAAAASAREYTIPMRDLERAAGDRTRSFTHPALPFSLTLSGFTPNAEVLPKGPAFSAPAEVVDGFFIQPLRPDAQAERNLPALYLTLRGAALGAERREILWGLSRLPLTLEAGAQRWTLALRRQGWTVPFRVTLEQFTREFHPGTQVARTYESRIVKTDPNGQRQPVTIRMNEPLRAGGYTFFQASYSEDPTTGELSSVFAVVRNPADRFPLYATVIVTLGLLWHFGDRLRRYLQRERQA